MSAAHPDQYGWTNEAWWLAEAVYQMQIANWQRAEGQEKDFPEPIYRPGVKDPRENLLFDAQHGGLDRKTIQDPHKWLADEDPRWAEATKKIDAEKKKRN